MNKKSPCRCLCLHKQLNKSFLLLLLLTILLSSCGIYTLSGVSATGKIKVTAFTNSGGGPPNMAQNLTENLRLYYIQNSRLQVVNNEEKYLVEGEIMSYQLAPIAPTSTDIAAKNRLTMSVKVRFTNNQNSEEDFDQTFTQYADFEQGKSLSQVETEKIKEIFDKIIYDIFQKTAAQW
jgi:hypothetical protein